MAKRRRETETEPDGTTTPSKTVFIDTNLDTHLAMIVSEADTVSDLKKKMTFEHPQCFPKIGEIKIHALKVKRKGYFYHLSDSMLVKSAFEGAKKNWFLSVEAFSLKQHSENQHPCKLDSSNQLALVCVTSNASGKMRHSLPDNPSTSAIHEVSLRQPVSTKLKVPNSGHSSPRDSCGEISKDMEVKDITNEHGKNVSFDSERRSDLKIQMCDDISEGTKVAGTAAKQRDDKSKDGISSVQCNNSVEQSLETRHAAKKKRKIKKQNEDLVCDSSLKDNIATNHASTIDTSHPEIVCTASSLVDAGRKFSNDMEIGNKKANVDHYKTTTSDTSKSSDSGSHMKYDRQERAAEIAGVDVKCKNDKSKNKIADMRCDNSFGEYSQSGPAVKKRKIENKEGSGHPLEENKILISNSNKATSKKETIIAENSGENQDKSRNVLDGLFTEPPSNDHLRTSLGSGKKKRKIKRKYDSSSLNDQVATFVLPSVPDVEEERSFNQYVEINHKDLGKESDGAKFPGRIVQPETLSEPSGISLKLGNDICEPGADNVNGKSVGPELAARGTKSSKKHHATNMKEIPPLVLKETQNLDNDVGHTAQKNTVDDDHKFETDQIDKIEEEKELSLNHRGEADVHIKEPVLSRNLLNAKGAMDSGNSKGSKRRKKRATKSAAGDQDTLRDDSFASHAERKEVPEEKPMDVSSASPDKDGDNMCGNKAEVFPLIQMNRELSLNHDTEMMLSERCKYLFQGDADVNINKPDVSAKLLDARVGIESGNIGGSKRKVKKAKNSSSRNKDVSDKTEKEEIHIERIEEVSQQKSMDTSFVDADGECDNMGGNEAELRPQTQVNRSQEKVENVDDKSRKKARKSRISTTKSLSDYPIKEQGVEVESLQLNQFEKNQDAEKKKTKSQKSAAKIHPDLSIKEQEVAVEELTSSNDKLRHVDTPSKTKKPRLSKKNSVNQLIGSGLELEHISRNVDSSHVLTSRRLEDSSKGKPEAKADANKHVEISKCEGDEINFKNYFVSGQGQNGFASADKVKEATRSDRGTKAKNTKKSVLPSVGTSSDFQNPHKSFEKQGSGKKSHIKNSSSIQPQDSLSKDENNEVMLPSKSKSLEVSGIGAKAPALHDIDRVKTPQEARRPDVMSFSGISSPAPAYRNENRESLAASCSSSESSDRSFQNISDNKHQSSLDPYYVEITKASTKNTGEGVAIRKTSGKNTREVVNGSLHEKSLLTTPGAIFRDDSSESSADEKRTVNSDASTRTPSHNSSSPGLEGESDSSLDSPRNGSYVVKTNEGGKNITMSHSSGPKNITMDMIFRSSSRFKAAKLTASQLQLGDSESQPVDFVPDSQANV